jgi:hypothetical protein
MTTYGIYRERARSAVLSVVMLDREAAVRHAEYLSDHGHGPHLVAASWTDHNGHERGPIETIRYNDPSAPRYIYRAGDWDSRSAWQPFPAPREATAAE